MLRLAPLGRKVQWDPDKKCEQAATDAEKTAYLVEEYVDDSAEPLRRKLHGSCGLHRSLAPASRAAIPAT